MGKHSLISCFAFGKAENKVILLQIEIKFLYFFIGEKY